MARKPVRSKRRRPAEPDWQIDFFLHGNRPGPPNFGGMLFWSTYLHRSIEVKKIWEPIKAGLIRQYVKDHPGRRPFAWWAFEAPEPRQIIKGGEYPDTLYGLNRFRFGLPPWWLLIQYPIVDNKAFFESEASYLDRHNLLTKTERKCLKPADFDPVQIKKPDGTEQRRSALPQMRRQPSIGNEKWKNGI